MNTTARVSLQFPIDLGRMHKAVVLGLGVLGFDATAMRLGAGKYYLVDNPRGEMTKEIR